MKKQARPFIPPKPTDANGLKSAAKPEAITVNLDNIELSCTKAVQRGFEAMRAVINAQAQEIHDLKDQLSKAKAAEGKV